MKVRVKFRRWDADYPVTGSALRKPAVEEPLEAERWQYPPRYEVNRPAKSERLEKVVAIRGEPEVQLAEVLPIRPGRTRGTKDDDLTPAELVQGLTHILNPASVFALALGLWRLGADLGLTSPFALSDGPFSHWQVWMFAAGGLQAIGFALRKRCGSADCGPRSDA
jgi:hypothetical protein